MTAPQPKRWPLARISEVELERLKKQMALQRLVAAKGVALEKRGELLAGKCPLHEDADASLEVTPKANTWRCTGCNAGGSTIDWVMRTEGVGFVHAVELLRSDAPLSPRVVKKHFSPRLPAVLDAGADDAALLGQVADYYHRRLFETETAREYLKKRGLDSRETQTHFRLGYADRTLGFHLPPAQRKDGELLRGRLMKLGVLGQSGHERLAGSLVVPIVDAGGVVRALYGRKVTGNLRAGTALRVYAPALPQGVFNEAGLAGQRAVVLCEAPLDALTFWAAGFRNVTTAWGVDGFTAAHFEAFKRHGVTDVLIAFDRDDAGEAAATLTSVRLVGQGFNTWRVLFPRDTDANAYALKAPSPAKALGELLRQAEWMGGDKAAPPVSTLVPVPAPSSPRALSAVPATPPPSPAVPVGPGEGGVELKVAGMEIVPAATSSAPAAAARAAAPPQAALAGADAAAQLETRADEGAGEELHFHFGPRRYRVRGLAKNSAPEALKVNVLASCGEAFHVDTFDLYQAKARAHFVASAASELRAEAEVVKHEVGQLLLKLEALQDEARKESAGPVVPVLSEEEREAALSLLRAPDLLARVLFDFEKCGVVGEETNKLVGYLAVVSRKLEEPLAVLIQSSSAAGKSSLMEAVLAFVPKEDKVKYSAMTGQSLFYMGDADLKHKVLAVVEEEGAARASYALKLLQSEGELTIASTGKNPSTGRLETHEYHVEGPTQLFLTTTATELDDELLNRCLVLTVDEERAQTQSIHRLQREKQTLEGLLARREKEAVLALHQNAQRLLRPLLVANPFARQLTFLDDRTRTRRDFPKYLTLIRALALLHQHQRPVKTVQHGGHRVEYVEATLDDVAVANRLAAAVLGRSLDELPPQTRRVLHQVEAFVARECKTHGVKKDGFFFTRRQLREALSVGDTQLKVHLARLVELELVLVHRGQRGGFVYELRADGAAAPSLTGLADVGTLAHAYDAGGRPQPPAGRGAVGPQSAEEPTGEKVNGVVRFTPLHGGAVGGNGKAHSPLSKVASYLQAVVPLSPEAGP